MGLVISQPPTEVKFDNHKQSGCALSTHTLMTSPFHLGNEAIKKVDTFKGKLSGLLAAGSSFLSKISVEWAGSSFYYAKTKHLH